MLYYYVVWGKGRVKVKKKKKAQVFVIFKVECVTDRINLSSLVNEIVITPIMKMKFRFLTSTFFKCFLSL